jgi:hypothetical protein
MLSCGIPVRIEYPGEFNIGVTLHSDDGSGTGEGDIENDVTGVMPLVVLGSEGGGMAEDSGHPVNGRSRNCSVIETIVT